MTISEETMETLRTGGLTELLVEMDCGGLADLMCLCDERVREAAALLHARFSTREQVIIWRKLCNTCAPPSTTNTGGTIPIGTTTPPAVSKPKTPPKETPPPAKDCSPVLPPPKSFT